MPAEVGGRRGFLWMLVYCPPFLLHSEVPGESEKEKEGGEERARRRVRE